MKLPFVSAIVVAGGKGTRIKSLDIPKQFYKLGDRSVLYHSVKAFENCGIVDEIIVVTLPDFIEQTKKEMNEFKKLKRITVGGETRQQSVYNGLKFVSEKCGMVAVHDGARPFVSSDEIERTIRGVDSCAAVIGTKVYETTKKVDENGFVLETVDREFLWAVQTPQVLPYDIFLKAYEYAEATGFTATDDVSLAEHMDYPVRIIEGSYSNIKITSDKDLLLANMMIKG